MSNRIASAYSIVVMLAFAPAAIAQDQPDIEENRQAYAAAFNAANAEELAQIFSDDAVLLPPDSERVEGRSAIEEYFRGMFEDMQASDIEIEGAEMMQMGAEYLDIGTYRMEAMGPGGNRIPVTGDYLAVVERGDGDEWVIKRHIWNRDTPDLP
jgi:uncharacterized protein (TIGR02246 family)